jgi:hypothetical protein
MFYYYQRCDYRMAVCGRMDCLLSTMTVSELLPEVSVLVMDNLSLDGALGTVHENLLFRLQAGFTKTARLSR